MCSFLRLRPNALTDCDVFLHKCLFFIDRAIYIYIIFYFQPLYINTMAAVHFLLLFILGNPSSYFLTAPNMISYFNIITQKY